MHVLLAALAAIVTILILLKQLANAGFDLYGLNPFLWQRRRKWRDKLEGNPVFSLEDPKDVVALLVVGIAKIDGDISAEEKRAVLKEFESTFALKPQDASALLGSSVHLLGDAKVLLTQLDDVLARSRDKFTSDQVVSTMAMLERVARISGNPSEQQVQIIEGVRARLSRMQPAKSTWG